MVAIQGRKTIIRRTDQPRTSGSFAANSPSAVFGWGAPSGADQQRVLVGERRGKRCAGDLLQQLARPGEAFGGRFP